MASLNVVLVKSNKKDKHGYLKIRVIDNRKVRLKTLGIKVLEKDFNTNKQRVRSSEPLSDKINQKIEETLSRSSLFNRQIQAIQSTSKTILSYYDEVISITVNSRTRLKYLGIRNKFEKYLNSVGLDDIKFDSLTQLHLQSFYKFIRDGGCARNTANYNINIFKSLVNRAISNNFVKYYTNPFDGLNKINQKIEETLSRSSLFNRQIQAIQSTSKTILSYYDEVISITVNSGTRLKYLGIRNKFEKYLNSVGLDDIKFDSLTQLHIQSFYKFIRDGGCARNTANYNIKTFKSLVNRAISNNFVKYYTNPFDGLKLKFDTKQREALNEEDIQKIVNKDEYKDTRNKDCYGYKRYRRFISYHEIGRIFLFQFNMQGMRWSDMQLLRWSDFRIKDGVLFINYTVRKTGKEMVIHLTPFALDCMTYSIINLIPKLHENYNEFEDKKTKVIGNSKKLTKKQKKQIIEINADKYKFMCTAVHFYGKEDEYKDLFVFPFLSPDDFTEYRGKEINTLNELQYKRLTGTRSYYNQLLKEVQKQNDILTKITSRTARHSYTIILVENEVSLAEISATLGYKHIATTQSFISRLNVSNIYDLNTSISKMFYK